MKVFLNKYSIVLFLLFYLIVNLLTLVSFPNVHSDELWLLGLTGQMIEDQTVFTTEPFYDLYPRVEHPFRWLYHLIYALFILAAGPSVFTARLVALTGALGALYIFYKWLFERFNSRTSALLGTVILSVNIQFVTSAHTGRQETWILFALILLVYWIDRYKFNPLIYALVIAFSIGIHPNSFIVGGVATALMIAQCLQRKRPLKHLIELILFTTFFASIYLAVGFFNNSSFLWDYFKFGAELGVDAAPLSRIQGFYWFFYKLYNQIGGTYDLYDIRLYLILTGLSIPVLMVHWRNHFLFNILAILTGVFVSLFVIGRYNQTSVLFIMPWIIPVLVELTKNHRVKTLVLFMAISIFILFQNISTYYEEMPYYKSYERTIDELGTYITEDAIVLGNLNSLEAGGIEFYDIRNLACLSGSFAAYIEERAINTIIVHEEMSYLKDTSPKWDFLYVNLNYYSDMTTFLEQNCELVHTLENPTYAMRITKYTGTYPWTTKIYRVN